MVAVVVPSPATSEVFDATSRTICAPMFSSGSFRSISLATVTPSFVMVGDPNFLSITTLRPFGPRVRGAEGKLELPPPDVRLQAVVGNPTGRLGHAGGKVDAAL